MKLQSCSFHVNPVATADFKLHPCPDSLLALCCVRAIAVLRPSLHLYALYLPARGDAAPLKPLPAPARLSCLVPAAVGAWLLAEAVTGAHQNRRH